MIDLVAGIVMNISFVNLKSKLHTHQVHYALKIVCTVCVSVLRRSFSAVES